MRWSGRNTPPPNDNGTPRRQDAKNREWSTEQGSGDQQGQAGKFAEGLV